MQSVDTSPPQRPNERAEPFAAWMLESFNRAGFCLMASVGHRLGLFDVMQPMSPATSHEIAARTGLNERYIREWLGAMTTSRVVECASDGQTDTYSLPAEVAAVLTSAAGADNLAALTQYISLLGTVEDDSQPCGARSGRWSTCARLASMNCRPPAAARQPKQLVRGAVTHIASWPQTKHREAL